MCGKYTIILLILQIRMNSCNTSGLCKPFEIKHEHLNKRLIGHSFFEAILNHHDCVRYCTLMSVCKSIDYDIPKQMCGLNDVDSFSVQDSELETKYGAVFSDIIEWPNEMAGSCSDRPCTLQQLCVPTEPHQCMDISCGSLPSVDNGTIQLVEQGRNFLLDKASVVCKEGHVSDQVHIFCKAPEKLNKATCVYEDLISLKCTITGTWETAACSPVAPPTAPPTESPTAATNAPPTAPPTGQSTGPPTGPPTAPPTGPPTAPPTGPPTAPPTGPPTAPPTEPPTAPPTEPPTGWPTIPTNAPPTAPPTASPTTTQTLTPACTIQPGDYVGSLSTTKSGYTCQRWDSQLPYSHKYKSDDKYPDGSVSGAANYCRALGETYLWCYTTGSVRWEECTKPFDVC